MPSFKRLIVCMDGTWNSPEKRHVTNVVRTARAIRPVDSQGVPQLVFYDWGVGSERGTKLRGGALGAGLDKNIQDAYRFIVHNYSRGDQIYLFGFSRGAYSARSTAGLIRNAGILKKLHAQRIPQAYKLYRNRLKPDAWQAKDFRRRYSRDVQITFVGVWDTVGALGIPSRILKAITRNRRYKFHDTKLSGIIKHACHAVAINEKRVDFKPTLWEGPAKSGQTVDQVWFAGVHGDVGGGYPRKGLSDLTLAWMWERAAHAEPGGRGLAIDPAYRRAYVKPDGQAKLNRSWKGMYWVKGRHHREIGKFWPEMEQIHPSVRKRYLRDRKYRPKQLKEFLREHPEVGWG